MAFPTSIAVQANKLFAGIGDWYLAKTGFQSQQYDGPPEPNRPDNLFEPAAGDWGAHGVFDDRSHYSSPGLLMTEHRRWLAFAAAGLASLLLGATLRRK